MESRPRIEDFEGLVKRTARMHASLVGREVDDLEQELRVRVWRCIERYDPSRGLPLRNYVFGALTNKIKDYKRDAAREAQRMEDCGVVVFSMEDDNIAHDAQEFLDRCRFVERDEVYGRIDEGLLVLPCTISDGEVSVLVLLMYSYSKTEIALRLAMKTSSVDLTVRRLREKLADWEPTAAQQQDTRVVELALAA